MARLIPAHFLDTRAGLLYKNLRIAAHERSLYSRNRTLAAKQSSQPDTQMLGLRDLMSDLQAKLLAQAIYDIRILLSGYLGSQNAGEIVVREAAHLAYALHNEAVAILENRTFDPADAIKKIEAVDRMFTETFAERFAAHTANAPQPSASADSSEPGRSLYMERAEAAPRSC